MCIPIVLLNHQDDYDSLSTFAHEWGHAVHTQLTTKYQPYEKSHYSTFVAEAASIANEMLLNDHMVKHAQDARGEAVLSRRGRRDRSAAPSSARSCSPNSSSRSTRRSSTAARSRARV